MFGELKQNALKKQQIIQSYNVKYIKEISRLKNCEN